MPTIELQKNADGGIYLTNASSIVPGTIINLSGDYSYIEIHNLSGTKESPIIFKNKGIVTVGKIRPAKFGVRSYGKYFKFLIDDIGMDKGMIVGSTTTNLGVGWSLHNSTNYEMSGVEIFNTAVGFFANPTSGQAMIDCHFHHNRIRDLKNPGINATGPECWYLGNTGLKITDALFKNCIIEDNEIDGIDGDGVQVCNGQFIIRRNKIKNFARISRSSHRNGIISGANCTSQIYDNVIDGGKGVAITIFGGGIMSISNNKISNIDVTGLVEDIVYIDGRDGGLELNFNNNEFSNLKGYRKIIGNYTSATPGSKFIGNKGVERSDCTLLPVDTWIDYIEMPPSPSRKLLYSINIYDFGEPEIIKQ